MMERGKGEAGDFPAWFASRCLIFPSFLQTANEELSALRYRRQYKARLRDNRGAVCRQYETLADILTAAAAEPSATPPATWDSPRSCGWTSAIFSTASATPP